MRSDSARSETARTSPVCAFITGSAFDSSSSAAFLGQRAFPAAVAPLPDALGRAAGAAALLDEQVPMLLELAREDHLGLIRARRRRFLV